MRPENANGDKSIIFPHNAPSTEPRIQFWVKFTYLFMGFVGGGGALRPGQYLSSKPMIYRCRNTPYRGDTIIGRVCYAARNVNGYKSIIFPHNAPSTERRIQFWVKFTYLLMGFVGGGGALRLG
jgi:hypothetical protein